MGPIRGLGVTIVNTKSDDTCVVDRRLVTGASSLVSDKLGQLAATTLLAHLARNLGQSHSNKSIDNKSQDWAQKDSGDSTTSPHPSLPYSHSLPSKVR